MRTPLQHPTGSHPLVQEGMNMNNSVRNLLIASALMLLGIVAVTSFIRNERAQLSSDKQEVTVFRAAKDIPAGTAAKELEAGGYLETTEVLNEDAPPTAVGKMSTLKGLVSNEPVYRGEIVTLSAFDKTAGLKPTSAIKGNERLYAVPIQAASDAAGLVRAGDHVDIMASMETEGDGGKVTSVIARDVEVMETPETLRPEGIEATEEAPAADGDTKLYVLKTTDEEWSDIMFGLANADDYGLILAVRPSNGATETNITPISGVVRTPNPAQAAGTRPGPNPDVR